MRTVPTIKENAFNKGDPRMLSSIKIFYYNATEIASLVGMSPFSSGRTALLKAWKSVNKKSFTTAKKSFESGKLEKIAKNFSQDDEEKIYSSATTKALYLSNGIEREPKILDIVEKSYCSSGEESKTTMLSKTRRFFKFGGLIAAGVSVSILNYYHYYCQDQDLASLSPQECDFMEAGLAVSSLLLLGSVAYAFCSGGSSGSRTGRKVAAASFSAASFSAASLPSPVVERNCGIKYMYITPAKKPFEIKIGGRCDGLVKSKGEIIECKARQNKLFHKVYDTEKIQAMMYLAIMNDIETKRFEAAGVSPVELEYKVCKLVEEYKEEIDVHPIKFDLNFYEMVREKLINVTNLLYEAAILQDPRAQVKIFKMEIKSDDVKEAEASSSTLATKRRRQNAASSTTFFSSEEDEDDDDESE